jgi:hypothetical protein
MTLPFPPFYATLQSVKNLKGGFCIIAGEEMGEVFDVFCDETLDDEWRTHLCSFMINGATDAFTLKWAFEQAAWIDDKKVRNSIWLAAIEKGKKIYKKLDLKSKEGLEEVEDLMYMDQAWKDCAHR